MPIYTVHTTYPNHTTDMVCGGKARAAHAATTYPTDHALVRAIHDSRSQLVRK